MSFAPDRVRRLGGQDGFTLIELMVAMIICVVGIASTLVVFDKSRQVTTVAQKREAAVQQAERELERLISRPWAQLAYPSATALPVRVAKADHPAFHVSGTEYRWNPASTAPGAREALYGQDGGTVNPVPTKWSDVGGRASGEVHRYITEYNADPTDARRITVAVTVKGPDAPKAYIRVSSVVTNPSPTS